MVDTYAWGAYAERCVGSSPILGTKKNEKDSIVDRVFYFVQNVKFSSIVEDFVNASV